MLLDTSGLLCCFDVDERRHEEAVRSYKISPVKVIHNYVLAEFVALTQARRLPRAASLSFTSAIVDDSGIEIIWIDDQLNNRAMQLLNARIDKTYSLCDAVSFVLMHDRGITDALTTDRHFEQAGFRRLLS